MRSVCAISGVVLGCVLAIAGCDNKQSSNSPIMASVSTMMSPAPAQPPQPAPPPAPAPTAGAMTVQISGLAATVDANVTITGGGTKQFIKATATLPNLSPGNYTITAEPVLTGQSVMAPIAATQTVTVASAQTATATVTYNTQAAFSVKLTEFIGSGLDNPLFLASPPGDPRIFIAERGGTIRVFANGQLVSTPFLDLSTRTTFTFNDERGLFSFAFDPQFAQNGWVFVHFTDLNGNIVVERFTANPPTSNNIASSQGTPVISIPHPDAMNHYGGTIAFGLDGLLWMSTGDGGGAGDQFGNAQSTARLLGKMLRLDVSTLPYSIPPDNPFSNEIWAIGLRNPWRWSFDYSANLVYIADVGQARFEEVDVVPTNAGRINYGWPITEGNACYPSGDQCDMTGQTLPVLTFDHATGACAITGGYVYRGSTIPEIQGRYFYSDYCAGFLRSFRYAGAQAIEQIDWNIPNVGRVLSFGQDANRELYAVTGSGKIYRVDRQ